MIRKIKRKIKKLFKPQKPQAKAVQRSEEKPKPVKNKFAQEVAKKFDADYDEVFALMKEAKEKLGIPYFTFALKDYWLINDLDKIKEIHEEEVEKNIWRIVNSTGKSYEEVLAHTNYVKEKYNIGAREYFNHRFFDMTEEEIAKYKKAKVDKKEAIIDMVAKETGWTKKKVRRNFTHCRLQFRLNIEYYWIFRAWELTDEELATYVTMETSRHLTNKYNGERKVLINKTLFNEVYHDFTRRKAWETTDTDYNHFLEFIDGLKLIFVKPVNQALGIGTKKISMDESTDIEKLYNELISGPKMLVEECIIQHQEVAKFNPSSLNTIRAVVINADGKKELITCYIRLGRAGKIVDNFAQGGIICGIDPKTGVIITQGIDKMGNLYDKHPDSGEPIVGFKLPKWDEVVKTTMDALDVLDEINYVGWDVAICEDKVVLVEGNSIPDLGSNQSAFAPQKEGLYHLFEQYM